MPTCSSRWIRDFLALMATTGLLSACGVDTPQTAAELDVVATRPETSFKFAEARTYSLPDAVVVVQDPKAVTTGSTTGTGTGTGTSTTVTLTPELSQFILDRIATNMNSRGYTQIPNKGDTPDLFLEVSELTTTQTDVYYSSWYGYYGGYYAPYGATVGYAPSAVPYTVTTTYGSLLINATNPTGKDDATKKIPSVWLAVINGLLDTSGTTDVKTRIQTNIDQAFTQSPYFKRSQP